ncbi:hypothetical protein MELA_02382 [Candidatus Methylomirabilis lanthanidiphila]|uniref:Hemerythrin-like domain-containing protein n=1 Tax=Candidatus Methylomirabilis lanthanidiphila TaxID=2211376 RepID=A0A564ZN68_9BACT|nr:hemerythrin domain-containing protein [Candidatus Methylomirabilis lanthanidiphila]VUZ85988.1 hypothetical protein MELA_02382 [Candidatus Methylomirabilis lanthanidiphila]
MEHAWAEQMEQAPNPMTVPMDNPSVDMGSKDRTAILAGLLLHVWHGYRKLRDCLMELEDAMRQGDGEQARSLLQQITRFCGTSFRYEEDAVLPALHQRIGSTRLRKYHAAHDQAIRHLRRLEEYLSASAGEQERIEQAQPLIQALLAHVVSMAGLTLLIETLPRVELIRILQARERSLIEGKDVYEWEQDSRG